jgi:hypothetical protein
MSRELNDIEKRLVKVAKIYVQSDWWEEGSEGISKEISNSLPTPIDMVTLPAAMLLVIQFISLDKARDFVIAVQGEFGTSAPRVLETLKWQLQKLDKIKR